MNNNEQCWPEEGMSFGANWLKLRMIGVGIRVEKKELEPMQEEQRSLEDERDSEREDRVQLSAQSGKKLEVVV